MWYNFSMKKKILTSIRLTPQAKRLIELTAQKMGITQSAVIEVAIREYAKKQGVDTE